MAALLRLVESAEGLVDGVDLRVKNLPSSCLGVSVARSTHPDPAKYRPILPPAAQTRAVRLDRVPASPLARCRAPGLSSTMALPVKERRAPHSWPSTVSFGRIDAAALRRAVRADLSFAVSLVPAAPRLGV